MISNHKTWHYFFFILYQFITAKFPFIFHSCTLYTIKQVYNITLQKVPVVCYKINTHIIIYKIILGFHRSFESSFWPIFNDTKQHILSFNEVFHIVVCVAYLRFSNPIQYQPQEEISPFSRLNGDWMVVECRLNGDGKSGFKSHFSHHSVTMVTVDWIAGTFQWLFSQLIFWKIKLRQTRLEPGSTSQ